MTPVDNDNQVKQIAAGAAILALLTALVCGTLAGWRYVPGLLGEWLGMMVGVMTTPFLLEASFVILGLTLVLALNYWHQRRTGDEWVDLEMPRFLPCASPASPDSIGRMSEELVAMNMVHFVKMAYGDVPWLRGLAHEFFRETHALMPQWLAMVEAGSFDELRVELHRCKGGASLFGFERLVAMLASRQNPPELETHGFDVVAFKQELDAAEKAVTEMTEPAP